MCFSLDWLMHLLIFVVVVCGIVALIRLLIRFIVPRLGISAEIINFIVSALTIVLWVFIGCAAIYFIISLIACISGGTGGTGLGFLRLH